MEKCEKCEKEATHLFENSPLCKLCYLAILEKELEFSAEPYAD